MTERASFGEAVEVRYDTSAIEEYERILLATRRAKAQPHLVAVIHSGKGWQIVTCVSLVFALVAVALSGIAFGVRLPDRAETAVVPVVVPIMQPQMDRGSLTPATPVVSIEYRTGMDEAGFRRAWNEATGADTASLDISSTASTTRPVRERVNGNTPRD